MPLYSLDGLAPETPSEGAWWLAPDAHLIGRVRLHGEEAKPGDAGPDHGDALPPFPHAVGHSAPVTAVSSLRKAAKAARAALRATS